MVDENAIKEVLEKALEGYFSSDLSIEIDAGKICCTFLTRNPAKEEFIDTKDLLQEIGATFNSRTGGCIVGCDLGENSERFEKITHIPEQESNSYILQRAILTIPLAENDNEARLNRLVAYLSAAKEMAVQLENLRDKEIPHPGNSTTIRLRNGLAQLITYTMSQIEVIGDC